MRVFDLISQQLRDRRAHGAWLPVLAVLVMTAAAWPGMAQEHTATPSATERAAPAQDDSPRGAASTPAPDQAHAAAPAEHAAEGDHGESLGAFLSRIANFLLLVGGIWYFARSPLGKYLASKAAQIGHDLAHAERTRQEAQQRMAAIDQQMKALPAEIDALRARGAAEIAAEDARIRELAGIERERLLEQTRREIDTQLRAARRDLARHAAELAVNVAAARIKTRITDDDHARLVDRYVSQVKSAHD